jgi:hypothetical protein
MYLFSLLFGTQHDKILGTILSKGGSGMRKLLFAVTLFLCSIILALPVSAQNAADQIRGDATIAEDGSCAVTLTASVTLDEPSQDLTFPIPSDATDVTVNGAAVTPTSGPRAALVPLRSVTGGMAGHHTIVLTYRLPAVVATQKDGTLLLTLPILSGFSYPVSSLTVTVTLPGQVTEQPAFISGYYHDNTDALIYSSVEGSRITIVSSEVLKDHETLTMTLPVSEDLFPQTAATARVLGIMDLAIMGVVLLAVAYYGLALMPKKTEKRLHPTAPDGITAGDLSLWLTGNGMDFSLLVVTWAQLGYIRIQVDDSGRVLLHKRMEMGNERSAFENRCYKNLFGRRRIVDGTGYHYAELVRSVRKKSPQAKEVYQSSSGNPYIFRGLCALAALLSGISLAGAFASYSAFLRVLLALLTTVMALFIQSGARSLALRNKLPLWIGLGCCGLWLILGIWSGEWLTAILMIVFQTLAGIAATYGGKRTYLGQTAMTQILGLRNYMRTVTKAELQRMLKANPGYFHDLAPYALALGVDQTFARRFGRLRLPECSYLIGGNRGQMTAVEWAALLRTTVDTLDAKAKRLPLERLTGR